MPAKANGECMGAFQEGEGWLWYLGQERRMVIKKEKKGFLTVATSCRNLYIGLDDFPHGDQESFDQLVEYLLNRDAAKRCDCFQFRVIFK